ncbi:tetratricopeptide repeat protein, partial [Rhodobacterales bacterium HKCCSP123]|nr:tetratricopeptide repeat protein [Rhodobacterales bacterium HKCCSP123]
MKPIPKKISLDYALLEAARYSKSGKKEQAIAIYEYVHSVFSCSDAARLGLQILQESMSTRPVFKDPPAEIFNRLVVEFGQGNYKELLKRAPVLARSYPNSFEILNMMGVAEMCAGDLVGARGSFEKAIDLHVGFAAAYNNLGVVLQRQGEIQNSIDYFHSAIAANPEYAEALTNLGNALTSLGRYYDAIKSYQISIEAKPSGDAYFGLGNALKSSGDLDNALIFYRRALSVDPKHFAAASNMGNVYRAQGKFEEALKFYRRAVEINPSHPQTYNNMGALFQDLGLFDKAISCLEEAVGFRPDFSGARGLLLLLGRKVCDWGEGDGVYHFDVGLG